LLALLEDDLNFTVDDVVYTGDTGFRVTVRSGYIQQLTEQERASIAEYVTGAVDPLSVIGYDPRHASVLESDSTKKCRVLVTSGGWGERVIARFGNLTNRLQAGGVDAVTNQLLSLPGVTSDTVHDAVKEIERHPEAFRSGVISLSESVFDLSRALIEDELDESSADIDTDATTDLNRYVRVPGSLNSSTGLRVHRFDAGDVDSFDPLRDAVPDWERVPGVPSSLQVRFDADALVRDVTIGDCDFTVVPGDTSTVPVAGAVYVGLRGWGLVEGTGQ
jgi:DNA primase catalytic subunit